MKMKFTLTLALVLISTLSVLSQQDPLYNLYLFNQGMINPAYNGTYNAANATLISRAQWTGIDGAPVTNTLNASSSFLNEKLGAGLLIVNDRLGVNNNFEATASFAYHLKFQDSRLSFGMQGGVISYKYDYDELNLEVVDQTLTQEHMPNFTKPTVGAGVFYRGERYFAGLSVPRLLNVEVVDGVTTSTRYKRHLYLSGGFIISRFDQIKIKPSALLRIAANQPAVFDTNVSVLFLETLWAGVQLRNFQSLGFNAQLQVKHKFRFGYAYELPTNSLFGSARGTHELMLSIDMELSDTQFALRRYF